MSTNTVVFDHTALLALGTGNPYLSGFVSQAHRTSDRHVFTPALCLAAASATRPALGEHVGALPEIEVIELAYSAALAVGRLVQQGVDWQMAHAVYLGRPDLEWPRGRPVLTSSPKRYAGLGVVAASFPEHGGPGRAGRQ